MKKIVNIMLCFGVMTTVSAQNWNELELSIGVQAVQGEMADVMPHGSSLNPLWELQLHTRGAKSDAFSYGGSISAYTMSMYYDGQKNWLKGHSTLGYGINAMASMRLLMTGRDDFRFLKNAFFAYLELGAGGHYINFRSTYPEDIEAVKGGEVDEPTADLTSEFAPAVGLALGFQYYIDHDWGVNLRLNGQYVHSDHMDGIQGITDINDFLHGATVGVIYGF